MEWSRKPELRLRSLLLLLALSGVFRVLAQENESVPVWNDDEWNKARSGIEYHGQPNAEPEEIPDIDIPEPTFDFSPMTKFICIAFVVILLAATIAFLLSRKGTAADRRVSHAHWTSLEGMEELPEESELERFLRLALEAGDHKTAVRILYISLIQKLHEVSYIMWKKDKTNRDYLNEMRNRKSYAEFRQLTLAYELVWYGDTNIGHSEFTDLRKLFDRYKMNLNGTDKK